MPGVHFYFYFFFHLSSTWAGDVFGKTKQEVVVRASERFCVLVQYRGTFFCL